MILYRFFFLTLLLVLPLRGAEGLAVVRPQRTNAVDFRREVLPLLQANCLPCHNKTTTKADLLLETPADMLKGGETGPALVAGKAAESLLMKLSTHTEKPRMPPRDNKVNAVDFTPEQLGLLARWIDEGARDSEGFVDTVRWLVDAPELRAIYSVALTPEGQYVAAGRGNRLFVYHRPTAQFVTELKAADTAIEGGSRTAHRDQVGALAFRSDGLQLASGGFREVKLWRRVDTAFQRSTEAFGDLGTPAEVRSADGSRSLREGTNGWVELLSAEGQRVAVLETDARTTNEIRTTEIELSAARSVLGVIQRRFEGAEKEQKNQTERLGRAREVLVKTGDVVGEKLKARAKAGEELIAAEAALAQVKSEAKDEDRKALTNRVETAKKPAEETKRELETAVRKQSVSEDELRLAELGVQQSRTEFGQWQETRTGLSNRVGTAEQSRTHFLARLATNQPSSLRAISADARWVATLVAPDRIALWAGSTGEPIETWEAPSTVDALEFGTNQTLRFRSGDTVYVRDLLPRWELQAVLGGETARSPLVDRVGALAYSPDGRWLASGSGEPSRSGDVQLWDPASGVLLGGFTNLHSDTVLSLAFSPDSRTLASGGADRFARLVDPRSGRSLRALEGHTGHVLAVAWKEDESTIATGGADQTVKFWDSVTGEKRKQAGGLEREVTGVVFLKGDLWVTTGNFKELRVINENGERVRGFTGLTDLAYALAVSADGRWVAAGGEEGVLRIWDREVEAPKYSFEAPSPAIVTATQ